MKLLLITLLLTSCSWTTYAATKKNERYYQTIDCNKRGGVIEYKLPNKTRVDCLTDDFAIEHDFASKFYEGITQAMYYAMRTGKDAKVVLILKKKSDLRYVSRAKELIKFYYLPVEIEAIYGYDN